jgi:hypothetical protein
MRPCPTYSRVQAYILKRHGFTAETCWIADVKKALGYPVRTAWNRNGVGRVKPCPPSKRSAIEDAIKTA